MERVATDGFKKILQLPCSLIADFSNKICHEPPPRSPWQNVEKQTNRLAGGCVAVTAKIFASVASVSGA
jgi:hypothetical protein